MIAIVITDGEGSPPVIDTSKSLKQKGVRIFVVGITHEYSEADKMLKHSLWITERKNDVILTLSFFSLLHVVDKVVNKVLSAIGNIITFDFCTTRLSKHTVHILVFCSFLRSNGGIVTNRDRVSPYLTMIIKVKSLFAYEPPSPPLIITPPVKGSSTCKHKKLHLI